MAVSCAFLTKERAMKWSKTSHGTSLAWVRALRAAALLLNREVCRHVLACRADLPAAQRLRLERICRCAWEEASSLYSPEIWERFEIDEVEIQRRATGLARLRMAGRLAEARQAEQEALRRSLSAA